MATHIEELKNYEKPKRKYMIIELFAGCGGNAIAYDKVGFETLMLNEIDKDACNTLKANKPDWNVVEDDIHKCFFARKPTSFQLVGGIANSLILLIIIFF